MKSDQCNRNMQHFMKNIFRPTTLFLFIATVKTRHVLKQAWPGLSNEGGTELARSWGHDVKVMFLNHDLKILLFRHDFMTFFTLYPHHLKALAMLVSEQVLFSL